MRRPEHTEDRSPVELPWSLIQGGSFLTAFQAAQHITILTLLCSAKEKLWWKHNWETGKSLYVCECVCVWECAYMHVCASVCTCVLRVCAFMQACMCVSSMSVFVHACVSVSACMCVCVTTKTGQQWGTKQCQAATLCSLITKWILYSWVCSYWLIYKGLIFWFILMLMIQLNYQSIKPNQQYVWKKFFKWRVMLPNVFCHFINVVS